MRQFIQVIIKPYRPPIEFLRKIQPSHRSCSHNNILHPIVYHMFGSKFCHLAGPRSINVFSERSAKIFFASSTAAKLMDTAFSAILVSSLPFWRPKWIFLTACSGGPLLSSFRAQIQRHPLTVRVSVVPLPPSKSRLEETLKICLTASIS